MPKKKSAPTASFGRAYFITAVFVFAIPFYFQYHYLLNAFYHFGAVMNDAGWLANTSWHNSIRLLNPYQFGDYSVLAIHFYFILEFLNLLSYVLPFGMVEFYATVNALIYTGMGLAMFAALWTITKPKKLWQYALAAAMAIGYAFNGVVMQGVWMTHIEYAIPLGLFLFFYFYAVKRMQWAILSLAVTLIVREDAGFHAAAVLILLTLIKSYKKRDLKAVHQECVLIGCCLAASIIAWFITYQIRETYSLDHSLFAMTFTGTPPYAHLTYELLTHRLHIIFMERSYVWIGALVSFGWALFRRNPYYAVGFAAYIPWFLLNWTAALNDTGELYAYYAFPFALSLGWPVLAAIWQYGAQVPAAKVKDALYLQGAMVLAGLIVWNIESSHLDFGPTYWARWGSYAPQEGTTNHDVTLRFLSAVNSELNAGSSVLGVVMGDRSVLSLAASPVSGRNMLSAQNGSDATVDTLLYFNPYMSKPEKPVLEQLQKRSLAFHYCVLGTTVCAFSDKPPASLGAYATYFVERPAPPLN